LKRFLLFILLLVGTGCKLIHNTSNNIDSTPGGRSAVTVSEKAVLQAIDSIADKTAGQEALQKDSLQNIAGSIMDSALSGDSTLLPDSSQVFTLKADSLQDTIPRKKGSLEAVVDYQAEDSIVWTAKNIAYIFGDGDVKYQNIELKAENIQMKMDSSLLYATYGTDSIGEKFGFPVFAEGEQNLEAYEMRYNFKSKKAAASHVVTKQGEGFVIADKTKKTPDDVLYMEDGKYTSCDAEHPHFYINMTKAKARPGKDIVTGPAYLVIEDVPLFPLVLPFAFFPFTSSYSSGIIMPSYGDEMRRGFFLRNGGYYLALSDYYDLALTGELYTKGSWGVEAKSSYRKRYKYSGNVNASYLVTQLGDKGMPDFSKTKDFKIRWSHQQDPKANPNRTVSASVDFATSSYDRNQLNSLYTSAATQNNKGSSVNVSQRFPNSPFSLSATMNINQRSQDSSVSVTLPNLTLSLSRINPFKRKNAVGKEKWYEKISMSYTGTLQNNISTKENKLFNSSLIKDWKNGMQHTIPVSATYTFLDYLNISPSFNYTERWYTNKTVQGYNHINKRMVTTDTLYGFYRVYNYSASISASTTLYGMFIPIKPFRKWVQAIRHRMDPSVSFSATPDFGDPKYGYYKYYDYTEYDPNGPKGYYTPFSNQLYGVPGIGKSGSVNFSLDNNIEGKFVSSKDSSGFVKISLIDKLGGSISYNLAADSFQWSNLSAGLRLKLSKSYTLNLNMMFDTYTYGYNESTRSVRKINKTRWAAGKGIGRLMSTGTSFSYTFNNDTFKKWFGGGDGDKKKKNKVSDETADPYEFDPDNPDDIQDNEMDQNETGQGGSLLNRKKETTGDYDEYGYYKVTIPWTFSFSYNLNLSYGDFNPDKLEYNYRLTHALSFNGSVQPTKNWKLNFNATYDFDNSKISYMTCNISRSMHCFQMSASLIPIGPLKSYSFSISASSSMLKDLKYDQSSTPYTGQSWY
jgi:hypothetical protein